MLLIPALGLGCEGEGSQDPDADTDAGAGDSCDRECVTGWWIAVTGDCGALCSLEPQPRECPEPDCEWLEAQELQQDGSQVLIWATHSLTQRSFSSILLTAERTWQVTATCEMSFNEGNPVPFECRGETLHYPEGMVYERPSSDLETALVMTRDEGQGEYSY